MKRIMKKPELARELSKRTGFFIKNMEEVVDSLEEIIVDNFKTATFEEPSEIHLAAGVVIGGKRKPEGEAKDPRNGETIISPEKVIPYATFKNSIRQKLYVRSKKKAKK